MHIKVHFKDGVFPNSRNLTVSDSLNGLPTLLTAISSLQLGLALLKLLESQGASDNLA